jgi:hypothetical protein
MNNQYERYEDGNPEMGLPKEETPEMGIAPALQDSEAEIGDNKKGPDIGTVDDTLNYIHEEEREDAEREMEIDKIIREKKINEIIQKKDKPTIH